MTLAEDVAALQARLSAAHREASRAEGARDAAQAAADSARSELLREFNVDTVEAAQTLLDELRQQVQQIVDDINAALDRIGGV